MKFCASFNVIKAFKPVPNPISKIEIEGENIIYTLKEKVYSENLQATWVQLWGQDSLNNYIRIRRAEASPKQLESIK